MASVCNFDCICVDCDCRFYHQINLQERKVVKKLYDALPNPNKNEPNSQMRKANCKFGKLCHNANCGYRHRLSYEDRIKLIEAYNNSKIEATKTQKEPHRVVVKLFTLENKNSFSDLGIEELEEVPDEFSVTIQPPKVISWADIVDDDEFLMKF